MGYLKVHLHAKFHNSILKPMFALNEVTLPPEN
jgi:hypothetical protein